MKAMDSCPGQGANRSDSRSYREDLQRRRHGCEDAHSCFDISGLMYQASAAALWCVIPAPAAVM